MPNASRVRQAPRPASRQMTKQLLAINGKRTVDSFHRELGKIVWD